MLWTPGQGNGVRLDKTIVDRKVRIKKTGRDHDSTLEPIVARVRHSIATQVRGL
jgi:hypothetical protein